MKMLCKLTLLASLLWLAAGTGRVAAGQPDSPATAGPRQGSLVNSKPAVSSKAKPEKKTKSPATPVAKPDAAAGVTEAVGPALTKEALSRLRPERGESVAAGMAIPAPTAADVRKLVDDFKQAQVRFVEEEKALKSRLNEVTENERALIRTQIQSRRETFLDQQRDAREEIRKRVTELKDRLKDHQELIDQSKEPSRGVATGRKGGND